MSLDSPRRCMRIGGRRFPAIDYAGALELFRRWIDEGGVHQVCIVNVHTLVSASRDSRLAAVMDNAALNTIDGQPLRWYANLVLKAGLDDRVCGPELMLRAIERGLADGWKHYLLGGTDEVLAALVGRLKDRFPGIEIAGAESPPFRALSESERSKMLQRINASGADILWVGLGAPKQEFWISEHLHAMRVPVAVGVGAAFDFHAGNIARAPAWMQRHGLEWLFRVLNDRRLWRRYLSTNPAFLWWLLRDYLKYRLFAKTVRTP